MSVADIIRRKAKEHGVDPTLALAFAQIESGLNPGAVSPSGGHRGLYQFSGDWWSRYGNGKAINDPEANADAFMRYYKDSLSPAVKKALGRDATPGELYLAHQQGLAGGPALLQGGDQPAADALAVAYGGGPEGLRRATAAIKANGGDPNAPASQFANMWNQRVAAAGKMFDQGFDGSSIPISTPAQPAMMVASAAQPAAAAPAAPQATLLPKDDDKKKEKDPWAELSKLGLGLLASGAPPAAPSMPAPPIVQAQAYRPQQRLPLNPFLNSIFG
jgi:hypothetical protein